MIANKIRRKAAAALWNLNPKRFSAKISGVNVAKLREEGYDYFQTYKAPFYCPWEKDELFKKILHNAYDMGFPKEHRRYEPAIINDHFIARERQNDIVRRYNAYSLAKSALHVKGDFVECGVHRGMTTTILAQLADMCYDPDRKIWAIDSFEGVSEPNESDITVFGTKRWKKHSLKYDNYDHIKNSLAHFKTHTNVVKGWIPNVFPSCDIHQVAFAYIDVDLYEPTRDSLAFLYDKVVPGGILMFDDYGDADCLGSRKATDEFFADKQENIIYLMDALAFVIKR